MNLSPDPRQLKTKVTLSVMSAPESGFFSGDYMATSSTKSQDNLNVLNYDFQARYTYSNGVTEPKYSSRLQVINSFQNARIPEVNTAVSASSCTFAFGGIEPGKSDPVLDLLQGPLENYSPIFVDDPKQSSVTSPTENYTDNTQHLPKIPFKGKDGNRLVTYNIWNIVNGTQEAIKFIGPKSQGKNVGTLRTIKDPNNGAQVEVTSENTNTSIKRIFTTNYDAIYQDGAQIINPDTSKENIRARGKNGNNGFHINFSVSNMKTDKSALRFKVSPKIANNNYVNDFYIEFKIDKKPVIYILSPDNQKKYIEQSDLIAPVLNESNMKSYDIFVHFVGPNLLIGFTADITRWNTIIGFSGKEIYCEPETEIGIDISNANLKFAYSAIIFNNYNNNQLSGATKNFIIAEFKYSQKKIPNPQNLLLAVYNSFEAASYRRNDNPNRNGFNAINPADKNISYFADLRLDGPQLKNPNDPQGNNPFPFFFSAYKNADPDIQTLLFKIIYNTTIEGPAFMQVEMPHPAILASKGAANLQGGNTGTSDYKFLKPNLGELFYTVGDITQWVESWNVSCNNEGRNFAYISKTASITLRNIDTEDGRKYIDAIENNLLVVTIESGYKEGDLKAYFQGFITSTTYTRSGNDSSFELSCIDVGTYLLDNLVFDKNMLIAGMQHDLAIDSMIACSGFWNYYFRNNAGIDGIELRLNNESTNNNDLIKLNPTDTISSKLKLLLNRLNTPFFLPTFRWAEKYGFILESRNNFEDTDLKFTGLNQAGTGYFFSSNASNPANYMDRFEKDIHGLLTGSYTIDTDMNNLTAGLRVFGVSITGFLAREIYNPEAVQLPVAAQLNLLDYLAAVPRSGTIPNTTPQIPFVGFKKWWIESMLRNTIPDDTVLTQITNNFNQIRQTPVSSIRFTCYVSKPLSFHGKFYIKVLSGESTAQTDKYIYKTIQYQYDKSNNYITASVTGFNIPLLLRS